MNDPRTKSWVDTWIKAGPELEAVRREMLENYVYEDHVQEIVRPAMT